MTDCKTDADVIAATAQPGMLRPGRVPIDGPSDLINVSITPHCTLT